MNLGTYGGILQRPVNGKAQGLPHIPKFLLISSGNGHTFFRESAAGHGFGQYVFFLFNQTFSGKAVVVKAEGVKYIVSLHSAESCVHFRLGVRKNMADMQTAADGRGRCVDGIDRAFFFGGKFVNPVLFPECLNLFFNGFKVIVFFHFQSSPLCF